MQKIGLQVVHVPVMVAEVLTALRICSHGKYVDATYGRGGHSQTILDKLCPKGKLFAFDCDEQAIEAARRKYQSDQRFVPIHARFSCLQEKLSPYSPDNDISGIIADLGVSSPQLETPERGFSFIKDGPLDMRMDPNSGIPAHEWIRTATERDITKIIQSLGEERFARRISRAIVRQRVTSPIRTTKQLADLVSNCVPRREPGKHPATRTFLAIRMHVNRELQELAAFLPQCVNLLKRGGRLVIISFHSIEDRIVKNFMREASIGAPGPDYLPFNKSDFRPTLKIIGKVLRPDAREIEQNRRARSAVMRVAERVQEQHA